MTPETTSTSISISPADRNWAIGLGSGAGLTLGIALPYLWRLIDNFDAIPFHGLLELLMSANVTGVTVLRPIGLGLIGGLLMLIWAVTQPSLEIHDDHVLVMEGGTERVIRRDQVAGIYMKGSKVILESAEGRRLFAAEIEGAKRTAGPAFTAHGYPWEMR